MIQLRKCVVQGELDMKRRFTLFFLILSLIFTTACATKTNNQDPEPVTDNELIIPNFPEIMNLTYKPIELEKLESRDISSWEYQKSLQLGSLRDESVMVDLYIDENDYLHGVLKIENSNLVLEHLGYSHNVEDLKGFDLQSSYNENGQLDLVGIVGSYVLGYYYVFHDLEQNEWLMLHNWGFPTIYDINNDGSYEILAQFEGKNMNPPDISIYQWNNGAFHVLGSLNNALYHTVQLDTNQWRASSIFEVKESGIEVTIEYIGNIDPLVATYRLDLSQLSILEP